MTVDELIAAGDLESVDADPDGAANALEEARRHIVSARAIASRDPNGGYQLAYDAARKAVMAQLRAEGLRVRTGEGGHRVAAQYAAAALDERLGKRLDRMRRRRNQSEYGRAEVNEAAVTDAADVAEALVRLVRI